MGPWWRMAWELAAQSLEGLTQQSHMLVPLLREQTLYEEPTAEFLDAFQCCLGPTLVSLAFCWGP